MMAEPGLYGGPGAGLSPAMAKWTTAKQHFEIAKERRQPFEGRWNDCADVYLPEAKGVDRRTEGQRADREIYDSTPQYVADVGPSALFSYLLNPATKWFIARAENPRLNKRPEVTRWLYETRNLVFSALTSLRGEFYQAAFNLLQDQLVLGTGHLYGQVVNNSFRFASRPIGEVYVLLNEWGDLEWMFREYELFGWQVRGAFPDVSGELASRSDETPGERFTFLQVLKRREGASRGLPIESCHYWSGTEGALVRESGFRQWPYVTAFWSRKADETYGRGRGEKYLGDARVLQQVERSLMRAAQKAADVPFLVRGREFFGKTPLELMGNPGSVTQVAGGLGSRDPFIPVPHNGRIDFAKDVQDRKYTNLFRGFFVDALLNLTSRGDASPLKAAEVFGRRDEVFRLMGPYVIQQYQTFLGKLVGQMVYPELLRRGQISRPPRELMGEMFTFEFTTTAALALNRQEAEDMTGWLAQISPALQLDPAEARRVDVGAFIQKSAELYGIDPDLQRDESVIQRERQLQAQQEAMQSVAGAGMAAEAAGKGAQALQEAGLIGTGVPA